IRQTRRFAFSAPATRKRSREVLRLRLSLPERQGSEEHASARGGGDADRIAARGRPRNDRAFRRARRRRAEGLRSGKETKVGRVGGEESGIEVPRKTLSRVVKSESESRERICDWRVHQAEWFKTISGSAAAGRV